MEMVLIGIRLSEKVIGKEMGWKREIKILQFREYCCGFGVMGFPLELRTTPQVIKKEEMHE